MDARQAEPVAEGAETEAVPMPGYLVRREHVLDADQSLAGYRLRILWPKRVGSDTGAALIEQAMSVGPQHMLGRLPHIITATPALLHSPHMHALPHARMLIDVPPETAADPELMPHMQNLGRSGLRFLLRADLAGDPAHAALMPYCKAVWFDLQRTTKAAVFRESFQHKQAGRVLYAAHVPDVDALDTCKMLGFTQFMGIWPQTISPGHGAQPSKKQTLLLNLLALILGDGDGQAIKACMEQDPGLVSTLLQMVNTPAFGLSQEVDSLNQAILLLGRRQLQRWIQILMYTESERPRGFLSPMLIVATARARFLESLARHEYPEQPIRAETAFNVGVLSVMNLLFGGTMQDLLTRITVDVPVRSALIDHSGPLGGDLKLAESLFPYASTQVHPVATLLRDLRTRDVNAMIQDAYAWSHAVTQSA